MASNHLPVTKQQEGRNPLNLVLIPRHGIGIHLHLHHQQSVAIGAGRPAEQGGHQAARPTPGGPEVHENRQMGAEDGGLEVRIGNILDGHGTLAGFRIVSIPGPCLPRFPKLSGGNPR